MLLFDKRTYSLFILSYRRMPQNRDAKERIDDHGSVFLISLGTYEGHAPLLRIEKTMRRWRHAEWTVAQTNESIAPFENRKS
jgi:hypothetical protein